MNNLARQWISMALLAAGCLVPAFSAVAAKAEHGAWYLGSIAGGCPGASADSPWRCAIDAQYRTVNDLAGFSQRLLRPSVGYGLTNGIELRLGYDRFRTELDFTDDTTENRYWQQASGKLGDWLGGSMGWRGRLEQRDVSAGSDLGLRGRFLVRYQRPVGTAGKRYLAVSTEPFVNFRSTDWGARRGFSENRANILVGQRFTDALTGELGYQNQYIRRKETPDRINHLLVLAFKYRY